MFGKINKYVVLKADFNCKLMFGKINFILPNIYFTKVYSILDWSGEENTQSTMLVSFGVFWTNQLRKIYDERYLTQCHGQKQQKLTEI